MPEPPNVVVQPYGVAPPRFALPPHFVVTHVVAVAPTSVAVVPPNVSLIVSVVALPPPMNFTDQPKTLMPES